MEYYYIDINMVKAIYSKDHKYIVEQLKKARQEAGLDQIRVAKLLGKTQSHISKVEAGQRRIDIVALKEFSRIYKKPIDYFLK
ncbi:MAG: helix-turn-helix transcriptional regulator [Patescibacteria group bacterium]